ncbi:hypothetical protein Moror_14807 [Moniliophthora roreri MCA 2997]|uniref:Uncharacterized protein n=1 Tax=Moniliophthora roreri (strain MCA 2997) TaxID=1381753 RepID=V2X789_MONRO|nr:hypothetical protein Moror_14807 [Moniliophthora roreri MCA 2997]
MTQSLNPYFETTLSPSESLDSWMTPSALQDADPESASYWGLPYGTSNSSFASSSDKVQLQLQDHISDDRALTSKMPNSPVLPTYTESQGSVQTDIVVFPAFPPITGNSKRPSTDLILLTADSTLFYVDEATLLKVSNNNFNGFLPAQTPDDGRRVIYLFKTLSAELEIMLRVIYDIPFQSKESQVIWPSRFDLQNIVHGISVLTQYGVDPEVCIHSRGHMFKYLLTCAALYPLDVYALAAQHDIHELAVAASSHLLSVNLETIDPAIAVRIGPIYLQRLFEMLERRKSLLSDLLAIEPGLHNPTRKCGFSNQQVLKSEWNRGVSFLTWNINAGITTSMIRDALKEATSKIKCKDCIRLRDQRLYAICMEWSIAARTI